MAKVDYKYKSYVLKEHKDLMILTNRCSQYTYARSLLNNYGVVSYSLKHEDLMSLEELRVKCLNDGLINEYKECLKLNDSHYRRVKRLKERIKDMLLEGSCLFLTLTFNDDTLNNTTDLQRRTFVSRYLKQFNCKYIANVDFGSKNHREHYHAVIRSESILFDSWRRYGNINCERIRQRSLEKDQTRLAKYVAKLSNHAIKETTKRSSLIYSR